MIEALEKLQRFEVRLDLCLEEALYDPTKFSISTGDDAVLDDIFSYQIYNKIKNHWPAATVPADVQEGMIWFDTDDDRVYVYDGAVSNEIAQITGGMAGILFLNDDACGDITTGICLNQGDTDNAIIVLKSSDVEHGVTTLLETDTYGTIGKVGAADGGVLIKGYTEATIGTSIQTVITTEDTGKTEDDEAAVMVDVYKKDGTGVTASLSEDANLFAVREGAKARMIVDEDGDIYYDGALQPYDEYDDVVACRDAQQILSGNLDNFLRYNEGALVKMGVLGAPLSTGGLLSTKGITALMLGAIAQLNEKNAALESKFKFLEERKPTLIRLP